MQLLSGQYDPMCEEVLQARRTSSLRREVKSQAKMQDQLSEALRDEGSEAAMRFCDGMEEAQLSLTAHEAPRVPSKRRGAEAKSSRNGTGAARPKELGSSSSSSMISLATKSNTKSTVETHEETVQTSANPAGPSAAVARSCNEWTNSSLEANMTAYPHLAGKSPRQYGIYTPANRLVSPPSLARHPGIETCSATTLVHSTNVPASAFENSILSCDRPIAEWSRTDG